MPNIVDARIDRHRRPLDRFWFGASATAAPLPVHSLVQRAGGPRRGDELDKSLPAVGALAHPP
jgi:hypothetical protein